MGGLLTRALKFMTCLDPISGVNVEAGQRKEEINLELTSRLGLREKKSDFTVSVNNEANVRCICF